MASFLLDILQETREQKRAELSFSHILSPPSLSLSFFPSRSFFLCLVHSLSFFLSVLFALSFFLSLSCSLILSYPSVSHSFLSFHSRILSFSHSFLLSFFLGFFPPLSFSVLFFLSFPRFLSPTNISCFSQWRAQEGQMEEENDRANVAGAC